MERVKVTNDIRKGIFEQVLIWDNKDAKSIVWNLLVNNIPPKIINIGCGIRLIVRIDVP